MTRDLSLVWRSLVAPVAEVVRVLDGQGGRHGLLLISNRMARTCRSKYRLGAGRGIQDRDKFLGLLLVLRFFDCILLLGESTRWVHCHVLSHRSRVFDSQRRLDDHQEALSTDEFRTGMAG